MILHAPLMAFRLKFLRVIDALLQQSVYEVIRSNSVLWVAHSQR